MTLNKITERVDNITHIPPEFLKPVVPIPKTVKIELTNNCDLKCKFCACSIKDRQTGNMGWETFQKLTFDLKTINIQEIGLFYLGESFLYTIDGQWKLADAVYHTKKILNFPRVFLTTNGVTASKDKVKQLIENGLDSLKFSFNFNNGKQSKEITGKSVYTKIVKNIKDARLVRDQVYNETGHRCELYASSVLYNDIQESKMKDAITDIIDCVDAHYWIPLCNQGGKHTEITTKIKGNRGLSTNFVNPLPCWSVFTGAHITYDGNVTVCCFDHDNKFSVGNITNEKFMDIWNGVKIQELRKAHLAGNVKHTVCNKCINS